MTEEYAFSLFQDLVDSAPDGVNFIVQDFDGDWFGFDVEPVFSEELSMWVAKTPIATLPEIVLLRNTPTLEGYNVTNIRLVDE